jgi:hypothetical protein
MVIIDEPDFLRQVEKGQDVIGFFQTSQCYLKSRVKRAVLARGDIETHHLNTSADCTDKEAFVEVAQAGNLYLISTLH